MVKPNVIFNFVWNKILNCKLLVMRVYWRLNAILG